MVVQKLLMETMYKYLALHCGEGERQTRMEHMDKSKTGSKQSPTVEGGCPGLVHLLAQRDLTFNMYKYKMYKYKFKMCLQSLHFNYYNILINMAKL